MAGTGFRRPMPDRRAIAAVGAILLTALIAAVVAGVLLGGLGDRGPEIAHGTASAPAAPRTLVAASPSPSSTTAVATPSPAPTARPPDPLLGIDGRFSVLLLGSDYRPAHPGNRTDAIMIVSVDPTSGQTAVFSIPRDTVEFPLPDGSTYQPKVNALYQHLVADLGRPAAGTEIKRTFGDALGIEIDSYAVIGFNGLRRLVDAVGGVDVVLDHAVADPYYWVTSKQQGVYFPAGTNHLNGERALIFARTRQGDNDYERARRQQLLVAAAVRKVEATGLAALPSLVDLADDWVVTDLPLTEVEAVYRIIAAADLNTLRRTVLGPKTYADGVPGTASIVLKLDVVRARVAAWAPPAEAASRGR